MIRKNYRIVQTIGKHVIAQDTLAGGGVSIGIDESAQFGIVITGLEVVEGGFSVLVLTMMPIGGFSIPHEIQRFRGVPYYSISHVNPVCRENPPTIPIALSQSVVRIHLTILCSSLIAIRKTFGKSS